MKIKRFLPLMLVAVMLLGVYKNERDDSCSLVRAKEESGLSFQTIPEVNIDNGLEIIVSKRVDQEDDLFNIITYQLIDGTFLTQVFPIDVKYKDNLGITRDKSNKLYYCIEDDFKYETRDNDIISQFPEYLDDGVVTKYNGFEFIFKSVGKNEIKAEVSENEVIYENIFEDGISVTYSPLFNGIKDTITLYRRPANNSFYFEIETNGVEISEDGLLINDSEKIGFWGNAEIVDSTGKSLLVEISYSELIKGQKYQYKIEIPNDYLAANDTQYPVYIDPTLYLYTQCDYYGQYQNVSSNIDTNYCQNGGTLYSNSVLYAGRTGTVTISKFLCKLSTLNSVYGILQNNITSAYISFFTESSYSGPATVLEAYPETVSWNTNVSYTSTKMNSLYNGYNSSGPKGVKAIPSNLSVNREVKIPIKNVLQSSSYSTNKGLLLNLSDSSAPLSLYGYSSPYSNRIPRISLYYNNIENPNIISGGIYQLSPCSSLLTVSNKSLSSGLMLSTTDLSISNRTGFPLYHGDESNVTYFSIMRNPSQLFKITFAGYGYTIQRITDDYYLSKTGSNSLSFVGDDDSTTFSTRWFFVESFFNYYYITHCFSNYLSVNDLNYPIPTAELVDYAQSMGIEWSLDFYCLGVPYHEQTTTETCGGASCLMILDWLGCDLTGVTDETIRSLSLNYRNLYGITSNYAYELALTNIIEGATGSPMYGISLMPNPDTPLDPLDPYGHSCYQYAWWQHSSNPEKTEPEPLPTDPPYPSVETPNHYYKIIRKNIVCGFPVILNIGFPSGAAPFTYSTTGHYVVAIGAYTLPSGEQHIIIMDPHYFASLQTQSGLGGPLNQQIQTPAAIDFTIDVFWNIKWSETIIRNILWNV